VEAGHLLVYHTEVGDVLAELVKAGDVLVYHMEAGDVLAEPLEAGDVLAELVEVGDVLAEVEVGEARGWSRAQSNLDTPPHPPFLQNHPPPPPPLVFRSLPAKSFRTLLGLRNWKFQPSLLAGFSPRF
jgi:hypothetical protein